MMLQMRHFLISSPLLHRRNKGCRGSQAASSNDLQISSHHDKPKFRLRDLAQVFKATKWRNPDHKTQIISWLGLMPHHGLSFLRITRVNLWSGGCSALRIRKSSTSRPVLAPFIRDSLPGWRLSYLLGVLFRYSISCLRESHWAGPATTRDGQVWGNSSNFSTRQPITPSLGGIFQVTARRKLVR